MARLSKEEIVAVEYQIKLLKQRLLDKRLVLAFQGKNKLEIDTMLLHETYLLSKMEYALVEEEGLVYF